MFQVGINNLGAMVEAVERMADLATKNRKKTATSDTGIAILQMDASDAGLSLIATNGYLIGRHLLKHDESVKVLTPGRISVDAGRFAKIMDAIPEDTQQLKMSVDGSKLVFPSLPIPTQSHSPQ